MSLPSFLAALFDSGRVLVGPPHRALAADELHGAEQLLVGEADTLRLEFPGQPPPLDVGAAMWGATSLYRACQLAVYRELDAGAIDELLGAAYPATAPVEGGAASRHWSVDLAFRFLPDLVRHAAAASPQDPLVVRLRDWCAQWPLSSVGVTSVSALNEDDLAAHAELLQLYVDRILAKKDWSRLRHPAVRAAAQRSLGAHGSLWTDAVKQLSPPESKAAHDSPA
jgi:hypothetical protein